MEYITLPDGTEAVHDGIPPDRAIVVGYSEALVVEVIRQLNTLTYDLGNRPIIGPMSASSDITPLVWSTFTEMYDVDDAVGSLMYERFIFVGRGLMRRLTTSGDTLCSWLPGKYRSKTSVAIAALVQDMR